MGKHVAHIQRETIEIPKRPAICAAGFSVSFPTPALKQFIAVPARFGLVDSNPSSRAHAGPGAQLSLHGDSARNVIRKYCEDRTKQVRIGQPADMKHSCSKTLRFM